MFAQNRTFKESSGELEEIDLGSEERWPGRAEDQTEIGNDMFQSYQSVHLCEQLEW